MSLTIIVIVDVIRIASDFRNGKFRNIILSKRITQQVGENWQSHPSVGTILTERPRAHANTLVPFVPLKLLLTLRQGSFLAKTNAQRWRIGLRQTLQNQRHSLFWGSPDSGEREGRSAPDKFIG